VSDPLPTITLRPYQESGIAAVRAEIGRGSKRVLMVLPTGGGKTVIAAAIITGAVRKGKRVLFLAHRRELIGQCYQKLIDSGLAHDQVGVILAGDPRRRPQAPVQVASVQTLVGRAKPPADVVFVDEAHHTTATSYATILAAYPDAAVVGLTATPCRGDGRGLGDAFAALTQVATFRELAEGGYLTVPRVFSTRHPIDLTAIKTTGGDYNLGALDAAVNTRELVGDIVEHWQQHAEGRTTVVFAASVEHSRAVVERFVAAGVAAEHLDGTTPSDVRDAILARLASGETAVVSNMGVLTEGWDLPRCKCVVLARPTRAKGLYLQMAGRGLRPWADVSALILDHGGCVIAHGFPQDDQEWSLDAKKKRPTAPPVKTCPGCFAALATATRVCPECGHVFAAAEREGPQEVDGTLVEVQPASAAPVAVRREWYAAVVANAARHHWKVGAARHQYKAKFGAWPAFSAVEHVHYPVSA